MVFDTSKAAKSAVMRHFIDLLHVADEATKFQCKPLRKNSAKDYVGGYFQKKKGSPHYDVRTHNLTEEQLQKMRDEYGLRKSLFNGARESLPKSNFMFIALKFWRNYCPDLKPGIGDLLVWVLQTKSYSPATGWVSPTPLFYIYIV